ncbi:uncharacterized protein TCAP_07019 [Tolypocladium capitatum]|uniref:Uncharacterized protein n=1 Tax=Tolypocladium capitatum TaxID=45235 RepID=A0A2K3Q5R3_9HYPO|nr:uncharacterized protein TCAP_07019 [Tolypocladium capitatum]
MGTWAWMQTSWGEATDVKVQRFNDGNYVTFWHGTENGPLARGLCHGDPDAHIQHRPTRELDIRQHLSGD